MLVFIFPNGEETPNRKVKLYSKAPGEKNPRLQSFQVTSSSSQSYLTIMASTISNISDINIPDVLGHTAPGHLKNRHASLAHLGPQLAQGPALPLCTAGPALLRWPQLPPPELGAGVTHALSHGAGGGWEGHRCQVFRLGPTVYLPCKVAGAPVPLGGRRPPGLSTLAHAPPALSPDGPHLSGQQEFPFFCLPQLHHVRQGLNGYTNQKTHRVFNARKRNASCFPIVPSAPASPKQVSLSS